jgi:hypothetical protein
MPDIGFLVFALSAGAMATLNPCGFAMLPAYLACSARRFGRAGSLSARSIRASIDFALPCSPRTARIGQGPRPVTAAINQAFSSTHELPSGTAAAQSFMKRQAPASCSGVPQDGWATFEAVHERSWRQAGWQEQAAGSST